jgi:hypothetical protein
LTGSAADFTDMGSSKLTDHGVDRLQHGVEVFFQIRGIAGSEPVEICEI